MRDAGLVLGVPIDRKQLKTAVNEAIAAITSRERAPVIFACANAYALEVAQRDPEFKAALCGANLVVADGVGAILTARIAGVEIGPRITGYDYFRALMEALHARGAGRAFFFGSSDQVLRLIEQRCAREFPSLQICGLLSPPFGAWTAEENRAMIASINAARPDVLWVGMTAPKQEKWVAENVSALSAPVIASVGAVFDFYAGTVQRAPIWMRRFGLEWVYRLMSEPRRLWKRYLIHSPKVVGMVLLRRLFPSSAGS